MYIAGEGQGSGVESEFPYDEGSKGIPQTPLASTKSQRQRFGSACPFLCPALPLLPRLPPREPGRCQVRLLGDPGDNLAGGSDKQNASCSPSPSPARNAFSPAGNALSPAPNAHQSTTYSTTAPGVSPKYSRRLSRLQPSSGEEPDTETGSAFHA